MIPILHMALGFVSSYPSEISTGLNAILLGYFVYVDRKLTKVCTKVDLLPCQKNGKRSKKKCYSSS